MRPARRASVAKTLNGDSGARTDAVAMFDFPRAVLALRLGGFDAGQQLMQQRMFAASDWREV